MPSVVVKLRSFYFKTLLKHKLLNSQASTNKSKDGYGASLSSSNRVPANASFVDGVATKDVNIDHSVTLRIFLPESALREEDSMNASTHGDIRRGKNTEKDAMPYLERKETRRNSDAGHVKKKEGRELGRRTSWGGDLAMRNHMGRIERIDEPRIDEASQLIAQEGNNVITSITDVKRPSDRPLEASPGVDHHGSKRSSVATYHGYIPDFTTRDHKKLPIIVHFHGGGFVTGTKDSVGNDIFCRHMAKLCDAIVVSVGYRLAPEHKYPAAFDDGFDALSWLAKQANLAECTKSGVGYNNLSLHLSNHRQLINTFCGSTIVEPWLAAHGDPSRCVLLGVSSGGNIADFVARKVVQAGRSLEPIKVVAQVLMYPFFIGSIPTQSEIKLANSYFYDKSTCILAWKLFFPEQEFTLDHPVANPLVECRDRPLKHMPPTLTVVAELDWMKDRAIAYSEELRKVNLDAPVLEYKDAVHEFATLDFLVDSRQAEACREDIAIWVKKYISHKGHELSY